MSRGEAGTQIDPSQDALQISRGLHAGSNVLACSGGENVSHPMLTPYHAVDIAQWFMQPALQQAAAHGRDGGVHQA